MRLASVSVDLDEVPCYSAIHDVKLDESASHTVYDACVPRYLALFAELQIPATLFVIGRDVAREESSRVLKCAAAAGHELANHSQNHLYDLTRTSASTMRSEIDQCAKSLEAATGVSPVGFRAPGYTTTSTLLTEVRRLGYEYDSSVFPCPSYYGAKAAAIGAIRARGGSSASIVDDPRILAASADPYRVGKHVWSQGDGMLELPIGVTSNLTGRLPFIGTSIALAGDIGARLLARAIAGRPLVNFELHGIDLADAETDGLQALVPHQPDLRKTLSAKRRALRAAVLELKRCGYQFVTLAEAARAFA